MCRCVCVCVCVCMSECECVGVCVCVCVWRYCLADLTSRVGCIIYLMHASLHGVTAAIYTT